MAGNNKQYCYYNPNLNLFRVLIPSILGYRFTGDDDTDNITIGLLFLQYLQKEIFEKVDIKDVSGSAFGLNSFAYAYTYPFSGIKGGVVAYPPELLGAGGLNLSLAEYCKVYHSVFGSKDGKIISADIASTMTDNDYGTFHKLYNVAQGTRIYYHAGFDTSINCNGSSCVTNGDNAVWYQLPDGSTCGLFVNAVDIVNPFIVGSTKMNIYELIDICYTRAQIAYGK